MFTQLHPDSRFAYVSLKWDENDEVERFVGNVKRGCVYDDVLQAHHITEQMVLDLRDADKDKSSQAFSSMVILVKKNICWDELSNRIPSRAELDIAQNIVTNLKALKPEQIQALVSHSEWLSEVQIRLYLPFLIQ
jgi:NTE family protein